MVLVSVFLWAVSFPLLKFVLGQETPMTVAVLRMVLCSIAAVAIMVFMRGLDRFTTVVRENAVSLVFFGVLYWTIPNVFQNIGMTMMDQNTAATVSGILQCSGPILTIILAFLILKEKPTTRLLMGMGLAFVGSFLLVSDGLTDFFSNYFWGNLLLLLSAFSYSVAGIIGKRKLASIDSLELVLVSTPFGAAATLLSWPVIEKPSVGFSFQSWSIILFLALFSGLLAVFLWFRVMEKADLSRMTLFVYLVPVVSGIVAVVFFGEIIAPVTYLFGLIILSGVIIAQSQKKIGKPFSPIPSEG